MENELYKKMYYHLFNAVTDAIRAKTKSETDLKKKTSGIIKLSQVVASNSQDHITASDISTTITISTATTNETDNATTNSPLVLKTNTTKNTTVKNTTTNSINNKVVNNTVNKTENNVGAAINSTTKNTTVYNTVEEDDIPYTGVEDTIVYVLFVAIAMALVFYIKFEKINKDIR